MFRRILSLSVISAALVAFAAIPYLRNQETSDESDEIKPGEDLSPAGVQMDMSDSSPLIRALYAATRETEESHTLEKLNEALEIINGGADLHAVDAEGRTALHWAAMGVSPEMRASIQKAYAGISGRLIDGGVDLNREDAYNNTAFDYLLYSSNYEMQTLFLENGGLDADRLAGPSSETASKEADLTPGLMIWIRLTTPVWSNRSRVGDPIEAVVTTPVLKDSRLILPPGTKLDGTVMFARKAPSKYNQARLVPDIANVVGPDSSRSAVSTRVLMVDNARETVENNEIHGIIEPHASKKEGIGLIAIGIADPIVGISLLGANEAYRASLRREIFYPAGTDLMVQVIRPSTLGPAPSWSEWKMMGPDPELHRIVHEAPVRAEAPNHQPSDLTNVTFIGSREELDRAFDKAGWKTADHIGIKSAFEELQAAARDSGYDHAPLSLLTLNGAKPDVVFQKSLNTISRRHHVRIWKYPGVLYNGRQIWIAAATHDIGVGETREGTKWFHRIDPWIDREREKIKTDLLFADAASEYALVDRPKTPKSTANATGDEIITDGKTLVITLRGF